jgi:hypothetical protein
MDDFRKAAPVFAAIDGLIWKIWIENDTDGTVGGFYYFKDQASLDAYQSSDMYKAGLNHPLFDLVASKTFNIIEDVSKVTRAPL